MKLKEPTYVVTQKLQDLDQTLQQLTEVEDNYPGIKVDLTKAPKPYDKLPKFIGSVLDEIPEEPSYLIKLSKAKILKEIEAGLKNPADANIYLQDMVREGLLEEINELIDVKAVFGRAQELLDIIIGWYDEDDGISDTDILDSLAFNQALEEFDFTEEQLELIKTESDAKGEKVWAAEVLAIMLEILATIPDCEEN